MSAIPSPWSKWLEYNWCSVEGISRKSEKKNLNWLNIDLAYLYLDQGGGRTKIKNHNLILGVNWAQKSIPTTLKAIRAIFIEL